MRSFALRLTRRIIAGLGLASALISGAQAASAQDCMRNLKVDGFSASVFGHTYDPYNNLDISGPSLGTTYGFDVSTTVGFPVLGTLYPQKPAGSAPVEPGFSYHNRQLSYTSPFPSEPSFTLRFDAAEFDVIAPGVGDVGTLVCRATHAQGAIAMVNVTTFTLDANSKTVKCEFDVSQLEAGTGPNLISVAIQNASDGTTYFVGEFPGGFPPNFSEKLRTEVDAMARKASEGWCP